MTTAAGSGFDLALWWDLAGSFYVPVWGGALVAAFAARAAARRMVPNKPAVPNKPGANDSAESAARRLARDAVAFAGSALVGGAAVVIAGIVTKLAHMTVTKFFFVVGVVFWATAVFVPAAALVGALRRKDGIRASLAALPIALAAFMLFVEPNRVGEIRGELVVPTLPKNTAIKIAHLSDIQTIQFSGREERALELVNGFDPDLVVITGDLTASGQPPALVAALQDWMARLKTKTSRYVVNGDSDPDFEALVEKAPGVTYLCDKGLAVDVNGAHLWIGGVDNHRRPPDPNYCMAEAPPGATRIFLSHNPDRFMAKGDWHAEVGLAGHTHGGQIHIPGIGPIVTFTELGGDYAEGIFPKDRLGLPWKWKVDVCAVCPGIGMEGGYAPRVRFLCPPRVVLLTLRGPG